MYQTKRRHIHEDRNNLLIIIIPFVVAGMSVYRNERSFAAYRDATKE
jgi:hypothetical protein